MLRPLSFDIKKQELEIEAAQVLSFDSVTSCLSFLLVPIIVLQELKNGYGTNYNIGIYAHILESFTRILHIT